MTASPPGGKVKVREIPVKSPGSVEQVEGREAVGWREGGSGSEGGKVDERDEEEGGRERKGGEGEWERIGDLCEDEGTRVNDVCIPPAVSPEVLISTVTGISFVPVLRTNSITVPLSSFTV